MSLFPLSRKCLRIFTIFLTRVQPFSQKLHILPPCKICPSSAIFWGYPRWHVASLTDTWTSSSTGMPGLTYISHYTAAPPPPHPPSKGCIVRGRIVQGMHRLWVVYRTVQRTQCPKNAMSKGHIVQGTHCPRDASSRGRMLPEKHIQRRYMGTPIMHKLCRTQSLP